MLNEKTFVPSNESMSLDHQVVDLALKSPNITETNGLWALMSEGDVQRLLKSFQILRCFDWESDLI